ncbi:MAG TPA: twin-arginine translocase subunit TatC, partial [Erythrobacter sp.]|nr:twin-arginine translocase subunit TatC [Erythrobacter sp.]
ALAAIITPPDPGSQLLLAVPLLLLFEGSLVLMRLTDRRRRTDNDGADEAQSAS